ncbi:MAG: AlpA family phage regulatory protein [Planctomycetales bacterium]|nr:AlpA family phage regulatory protein [Planctomycetales bacterium]
MKRSTQPVANASRCPAESNFLSQEIQDLIVRTRRVTDDRVLRLPHVREKVGRANATIWKDVSEGTFPPPVRIGPRAVGWRNSELAAWLEACSIASRTRQPIDMKVFIAQLIAPKGTENVQ